MFPPNLVQACLQQQQTILKEPTPPTDDLNKWNVTFAFTEGEILAFSRRAFYGSFYLDANEILSSSI